MKKHSSVCFCVALIALLLAGGPWASYGAEPPGEIYVGYSGSYTVLSTHDYIRKKYTSHYILENSHKVVGAVAVWYYYPTADSCEVGFTVYDPGRGEWRDHYIYLKDMISGSLAAGNGIIAFTGTEEGLAKCDFARCYRYGNRLKLPQFPLGRKKSLEIHKNIGQWPG
jgi:hypothetical protein